MKITENMSKEDILDFLLMKSSGISSSGDLHDFFTDVNEMVRSQNEMVRSQKPIVKTGEPIIPGSYPVSFEEWLKRWDINLHNGYFIYGEIELTKSQMEDKYNSTQS
jgi:hypothetical protein